MPFPLDWTVCWGEVAVVVGVEAVVVAGGFGVGSAMAEGDLLVGGGETGTGDGSAQQILWLFEF